MPDRETKCSRIDKAYITKSWGSENFVTKVVSGSSKFCHFKTHSSDIYRALGMAMVAM